VGRGKVGYAWVSSAQDIDWEGEDVRGTIGMVLRECLRGDISPPWVKDVPLERAPEIFSGRMLDEGDVVVKIVG
jgi:hypothetical protein